METMMSFADYTEHVSKQKMSALRAALGDEGDACYKWDARNLTNRNKSNRIYFKHEFLRSVGAQALRGVPRIIH